MILLYWDLGVPNHWTGKWTGMMEWTMEVSKSITPLQYPALLCRYLLTDLLTASSALYSLKVLVDKGRMQFNRDILYRASSLTCNEGDSSEV